MGIHAKPYTEYPHHYFKIVEHFQSADTPLSHSMTARQAQVSRRSLYRFFAALRAGHSSNPSYVGPLLDVARDLNICVRPSSARKDDVAQLVVELNPLSDRVLFPHAAAAPTAATSGS